MIYLLKVVIFHSEKLWFSIAMSNCQRVNECTAHSMLGHLCTKMPQFHLVFSDLYHLFVGCIPCRKLPWRLQPVMQGKTHPWAIPSGYSGETRWEKCPLLVMFVDVCRCLLYFCWRFCCLMAWRARWMRRLHQQARVPPNHPRFTLTWGSPTMIPWWFEGPQQQSIRHRCTSTDSTAWFIKGLGG